MSKMQCVRSRGWYPPPIMEACKEGRGLPGPYHVGANRKRTLASCSFWAVRKGQGKALTLTGSGVISGRTLSEAPSQSPGAGASGQASNRKQHRDRAVGLCSQTQALPLLLGYIWVTLVDSRDCGGGGRGWEPV